MRAWKEVVLFPTNGAMMTYAEVSSSLFPFQTGQIGIEPCRATVARSAAYGQIRTHAAQSALERRRHEKERERNDGTR